MRCEACGYYYYEMEENGKVEVIKGDEIKERIKTEFCTHTWKQSQFQMLTDDAITSYICTKCGKHSQF